MATVATRERCRHCGSSIIIPDGEGGSYCLLCGRPYHDFRKYGRIGGLQTVLRHGREHMVEIGSRGGRPKHKTLRQQSVHEVQYQLKGGNRLPNRLSELKGLWKLRITLGEASLKRQLASPERGTCKENQ